MPYPSEGTLTTESREVDVSETWDSQSEWEAADELSRVTIENGTVTLNELPDPDVYLHDDFGDNSLTSRSDSAETLHNGVEGIYRPEWDLEQGSLSVSGGEVEISDDDIISTGINLDLSQTVTWELTDVDAPGSSGNERIYYVLFAEQRDMRGTRDRPNQCYAVILSGDTCSIFVADDESNWTEIVAGTGLSDGDDVRVERSSDGEWALYVNDTLQGDNPDSEFTDPQYTELIGTGSSPTSTINEITVF